MALNPLFVHICICDPDIGRVISYVNVFAIKRFEGVVPIVYVVDLYTPGGNDFRVPLGCRRQGIENEFFIVCNES